METRSKKRSRTLTGDQSGTGGGGDDDGEMSLKISQVCSVGDRIRRLKEGSEKEKIRFLEKGGWNLLHDWIQQSYSSGNFRLLEDILRGIQSLPAEPVKKMLEAGSSVILVALEEILKETVDQGGLEGMRELYNDLLTSWKDLVIVKRKLEEDEEDDQGPILKIKKKAVPLETSSGSSEEEESVEIQTVSQKEPPLEEDDDENEYVDVEALSEEEKSVSPTPPPPAKPPKMSVRDPRRKGIELQQAKELERVKRRKRRKRSTRKELEKALEEEKKQEKRFHGVVKREKRLMKKRAISKEDKKEGDKMNGILFKKKRKVALEKPAEDVKPASNKSSVPEEEQRIIALEEDGGKRRSRVAVFVSDKSRMEGIVKEMETKKIKYPQKTVARVLPTKKKDPRSEGQKKRVTFQVKPHLSTLPPVQLPVTKSLNLKEGTGKELVVFKPPPPPLPVVTSTSKELVPVVNPQNNCSTVATRRKAPPPPQISSNKALLAISSSTSSPSFKIHRIIKPPTWKLYKIHFPKIMERLRVRREERLNSDEKSIQAEREFLQTLKYPDEVPPSLLSCDSAMEPEQASDRAPTRPPHSTVKINSHSVRNYTEVFNRSRDYWPRPRSERKLTIVQCRFPPLMEIKKKMPALELPVFTPKKPVELIDLTLSPEQTEVDKASGTTPTKAVGLPASLPSPPKKQPQKYFLVRVPQLNPAKKPVLKIPSPPTVNAPTSPRRVSFKIAQQSSSSLVPYLPPTQGSTPSKAALPEITLPIPMQSVLAACAQPPPESPPASPCLPLSLRRVTPPPSPIPKEPPPPPFQAVVPFPFQPPLPPEPPQVPRPPPPPPLPFTLQTRKQGKHQAQKLSVSPPRPLMSLGISPPPPFVPSTPQMAPTTPRRARPTRFSTPPPQFNQFNFPPPPPGTTSPTPTALVPYRPPPPPVPPQQQYLSNYCQPTNPFLDYGYGFPQPNWNNSFQPYNSGGFGPFYENNGGYRYVNNPFWQGGSQLPNPNRHPFGYWQF